jgi:hypothetical protein
MSLKARIRGLEADMRWLRTEGTFRQIQAMIKTNEMKQEIADRIARDPAAAARWAEAGFSLKLPPPQVPVVKAPPPPAPAPPVLPANARGLPRANRDAPLRDAPQGEVVRVEPPLKPPPEPPDPPEPPPFNYDPPEHMQIRPVSWRPRGAADYDDDYDDGPVEGRCLVDYDPLEDA